KNAQKNQARRAREIERGDPDGLAWVGRYDAALTRARRLLPAKEVGA
ncbi:MAG: hypothetical protein JKY93_03690, partial [Gammaproteobacteria bacterium]|nr:hypothetical protein [Gammaproteobacteria bacterium]